MSPKIAIIGIRGIPANFPGSSGIDTYIEQLLPYFKKNKITLYSRSWTKKNKLTKINIKNIFVPCFHHKYLDTGIYTFLSTFYAIFHQDDIFWYHAPGSSILIKLAKILGKKTILTIHGLDWQRQKWSTPFEKFFLKSLESMSVKNADICTAVSQDICQYIQKTYKKPCVLTSSSLVIKKPVPFKLIPRKFQINKQQPYILYLGRLVPEKRVNILIEAYLNNPVINQNYKLVISGLIEKNKYCKKLIASAQKHSNIIFTNYVTGQIKQELLSNCQLFVLPSTIEGNSLSLNEAIGLQKNCLISNLPIHQQYQKTFSNIITFKINSITDFQKKLEQSLKKPKTSNIKIKSNWAQTSQIYNNFFEEL